MSPLDVAVFPYKMLIKNTQKRVIIITSQLWLKSHFNFSFLSSLHHAGQHRDFRRWLSNHHLHFHTPLFVCLCMCESAGGGRDGDTVGRRAPPGGGMWGGARGSWGGLYCNMMFILVMYLTVEDNRGLSVW